MLKDNWGRIKGLRHKCGKTTRKGWYYKDAEGKDIFVGETIYQAHVYLEENYPDKFGDLNGRTK